MNFRLYKETMINVARWLEGQDEYERDIAAYGRYYLEPPPFKEAIPSIRKFHRLEQFPWPEQRSLTMIATPEGMRWIISPSDAEPAIFMDGLSTFTRQTPNGDLVQTNELEFGYAHFWLRRSFDALDERYLSDSILKECIRRRFPVNFGISVEDLRAAIGGQSPRWEFIGSKDMLERTSAEFTDEEIVRSIIWTVVRLWFMTSLVSPTGYKLRVRPEPFGPQRLRKAFASKPLFVIVNYERLYHLYRKACPADEAIQRFVQPHHRRSHPRHLWRKAGLSLESLPRRAVDRELLVAEKKVPIVTVRECWIGHREFSLNGWDFEVDPEDCQ